MLLQARDCGCAFLFIARRGDKAEGLRGGARGEEFIHETAADCKAESARGE